GGVFLADTAHREPAGMRTMREGLNEAGTSNPSGWIRCQIAVSGGVTYRLGQPFSERREGSQVVRSHDGDRRSVELVNVIRLQRTHVRGRVTSQHSSAHG
ncbi:hypothetical protein B9Q07_10630, partial [Candidatus Marsarchaeota G2 archaeon ECH_B_3]